MSALAKIVTRREVLGIALVGGLMATPVTVAKAAAQIALVMVEEPGCPYCARWHREIGPAYPNSPEGRFAPLIRVMRGDPRVASIKGLNYSPTFLVMRGDDEIGRILGYPGADFFWPMLDELLAKAGFQAEPARTTR